MCNNKLGELEKLLKKQIEELQNIQFKKPNSIDQYYEIKEIISENILDIDTKIILIKKVLGDQ